MKEKRSCTVVQRDEQDVLIRLLPLYLIPVAS